ncbi:hypothetical protein CTI12_AA209270 [Artemisia annua]|uniref:Uncharacterized protein n=1 Tax=Artemisia annua TaxID=35608 RepID=A0A2U1P0U7_ARTAN|nr:hypothetical protein CTI12_AA209270 [Artemisia annua]
MSSTENAAGILTPLECGQNEGNTFGNHLSGRRLNKIPMALNQHQERWVTVNPNKRKRASDALTNHGPLSHPFSAEHLLATHGPIYGKRVGEDQVSCLLCHPFKAFKAGPFRPGPR